MKKLFALSIMMLTFFITINAEKTCIIQDKYGMKIEKAKNVAKIVATFDDVIPPEVSTEKALESYKHPGELITFHSYSKNEFDKKYGMWRTEISVQKNIIYQDGKLILQKPIETPGTTSFSWGNAICMLIVTMLQFIMSRYCFHEDTFKDGETEGSMSANDTLMLFILIINFLIVTFSCAFNSGGGKPLLLMYAGLISLSTFLGCIIGYILRKKQKASAVLATA